jgi:hypothetical protein
MTNCTIGGYHSPGQVLWTLAACDLCGMTVCTEHRGLHWERSHSGRIRPEEREGPQ